MEKAIIGLLGDHLLSMQERLWFKTRTIPGILEIVRSQKSKVKPGLTLLQDYVKTIDPILLLN